MEYRKEIFLETNQIKAVLLDLDGTLADSFGLLKQVYYRFLAQHDKRGSEFEFRELAGPSLKEIVASLKDRHQLSGTVCQLYDNYVDFLRKGYLEEIQPTVGAAEFLQFIGQAGLACVMVTSAPRALAESFIKSQGWTESFDGIFAGDEVDQAKPHPEIYQRSIAHLEIFPHQALAVEDSHNGVRAAVSAGIPVVAIDIHSIDQPDSLLAAGAIAQVSSFSQIQEMILAGRN